MILYKLKKGCLLTTTTAVQAKMVSKFILLLNIHNLNKINTLLSKEKHTGNKKSETDYSMRETD